MKKEISVTIERPAATVTITINGKSHAMTEQEAKKIYDGLQSALGIAPNIIMRPPENLHRWNNQAFPLSQRPIPLFFESRPSFRDDVMCVTR